MQYIYAIRNKLNGKFYVGRTDGVTKRWNQHRRMLSDGNHHSNYFQNAVNKYGIDSFEFVVLHEINTGDDDADLQTAKEMEQSYIDKYEPNKGLYNRSWSSETGVNKGEDHHFHGTHPKDWMGDAWVEVVEKLRDAFKGENNPFYGKSHSEETIEHLRQQCANFGEENGMYGKHHTEEYKEMKREMMKGRYDGDKNPFYGKKHSEETLKKMSESMSKTRKGMPKSEKHKLSLRSNKVSKKVEVDGIVYPSKNAVIEALHMGKKTLNKRLESPDYPNYRLINA